MATYYYYYLFRLFDMYEGKLCYLLDQEARLAIFTPCYPAILLNLAVWGDIRRLRNSFL